MAVIKCRSNSLSLSLLYPSRSILLEGLLSDSVAKTRISPFNSSKLAVRRGSRHTRSIGRIAVHFDTLVSVITLLGSGNLTTNCAPFCIGLGPLLGTFVLIAPA